MAERHPKARAPLGHTETLSIKIHPDLMAHVTAQAAREYCTQQEYVRRLIIADMRRNGDDE
jgi:hypothetical protein